VALLVLAAGSLVFAQAAKKGPTVDKVIWDVRMQEDIAMQDVAEGKADIFMWGVQGNTYKALPQTAKDKLDVYSSPSGSWSVMLNPYPNKAPYFGTVDGKDKFNPLALQSVRFALNDLINRKYIVDEILGGAGGATFTSATPGQPGTYKYDLVASKLGMTITGNEKKAISDINDALAKASELTELKGRLVKASPYWTFDGQPITVDFLIRVDDPNGRLKEGRYIADQIEKAGIKVNRMELNRAKCLDLAYNSDPAKMGWGMYTEGWGAGGTNAYWEVNIAQWYAPFYGYMPGGGNADFWNYQQDTVENNMQKIITGNFNGEKEYWDLILQATDLGLRDSIRINIAYQSSLYVANKSRFVGRMDYGLGDGLGTNWGLITADAKPDANGQKVIHAIQFSAKGALFMGAWDPVGPDGMGDMYTLNVSKPASDEATFQAPTSAAVTPWRATWTGLASSFAPGKDAKGNDILVGKIPVPPTAVLYDSATKTWKAVGNGVTSMKKGTYTYKLGKWHDGTPMRMADLMYAFAFITDWSTKDGDNDKYYDSAYAAYWAPTLATTKGIVLNADGSVTTYFDYNHMDTGLVAASGALNWRVSAAGQPNIVSWTILEALGAMVAEGGTSKTAWSFSSDPSLVEVDVLTPNCLTDIKAKLNEFIYTQHVPESMKQWLTPDQAVAAYQNAIAFINAHKNAYISNGSFYIGNVDLSSNFLELDANRDPTYPFAVGYWNKLFATTTTRIDSVQPPSVATRGKDVTITVKVSSVDYPLNTAKPADATAKVSLILVTPDGDKTYAGKLSKAGEFIVTIPAADSKNLKAGSYTIVVQSVLKSEAPSVQPGNLVFF